MMFSLDRPDPQNEGAGEAKGRPFPAPLAEAHLPAVELPLVFTSADRVTPELVARIDQVLHDPGTLEKFALRPETFKRVELRKVVSEHGRDVLDLRIDTIDDSTRDFSLVLYKQGYSLPGIALSTEERCHRVAVRIVQMYRDFRFRRYQALFDEYGIHLAELRQIVDAEFRRYVGEQDLHPVTLGDSTSAVLTDKTGSMVVKVLRERGKIDEHNLDPLSGYQLAQNHAGMLVCRFVILPRLAGTMLARTAGLQVMAEQAVVQKAVPLLFRLRNDAEAYEGLLADSIKSADFSTSCLLIAQYLRTRRMLIEAGLFDAAKKSDYGYDPSVGAVVALDAARFKPVRAATDSDIREMLGGLCQFREDVVWWSHTAGPRGFGERLAQYIDDKVSEVFFRGEDSVRLPPRGTPIGRETEAAAARIIRGSAGTMADELVCYVGPPELQYRIAAHLGLVLHQSRQSIDRLERLFAGIGFGEITADYQLARALQTPYLPGGIHYLALAAESPYAGIKVRRHLPWPTVREVFDQDRYRDKPLADSIERLQAVKEAIRTDIVKVLLRFYDPRQLVYRTVAEMFNLAAEVDVSDPLQRAAELRKIPLSKNELDSTRETRLISLGLWGEVDGGIGVGEIINDAFERLADRRRFPFDVSYDQFLLEERPGGYGIEMMGFGGVIRKAREVEVVGQIHASLSIDYSTIFRALREEFGERAAASFLERVFFQTTDETLREAVQSELIALHRGSSEPRGLLRSSFQELANRAAHDGLRQDELAAPLQAVHTATEYVAARPTVVFVNPLTATRKPWNRERRVVSDNWARLNSRSPRVNILAAGPDDFVLRDDGLYLQRAQVYFGDGPYEERFDRLIPVHFVYGMHSDGLKVPFNEQDLARLGVPVDANAVMAQLERDKQRQLHIVRAAGFPAKQTLARYVYEHDPEKPVDIPQLLQTCLAQSTHGKIYIQPAGATKKYGSTFAVQLDDPQAMREELARAAWAMEVSSQAGAGWMLIHDYVRSIGVDPHGVDCCESIEAERIVNDLRVIVAYDTRNRSFDVGEMRVWLAEECQGSHPLWPGWEPRELRHLTDRQQLTLQEFLKHCCFQGRWFTPQEQRAVVSKLKSRAREIAQAARDHGCDFIQLAVDFIISNYADADGLPVPIFLEFASHFAGEEKYNELRKFRFRANVFRRACAAAEDCWRSRQTERR